MRLPLGPLAGHPIAAVAVVLVGLPLVANTFDKMPARTVTADSASAPEANPEHRAWAAKWGAITLISAIVIYYAAKRGA